jgi:beta-glucanase (GH16 family)
MKMTQTSSTNCTGAEIVSQNALNGSTGLGNYGTYEWRARWGSSSATPNGAGSAASGGVSSIFLYNGNNTTGVDYVEVDAPEAEGIYTTKAGYATFNGTGGGPNATTPPTGSGFTWDSVIGDDSYMAVSGPDTGYHYYGLIWSSGSLVFYLDGVLQGSTTTNVPVPNLGGFITNIDCNHYGTNSAGFGGTWSSGTRYAYVISIKYWS